jgi:hypothetical protein
MSLVWLLMGLHYRHVMLWADQENTTPLRNSLRVNEYPPPSLIDWIFVL